MRLLLHRVMEEIEEVVGDKSSVEADDLDKLTYMNQVCLYILLLEVVLWFCLSIIMIIIIVLGV